LNEGRRINQRRSLLKGLFSIKITFFLSFYLGGANQDTTTIACHFYCSAGRSLKALFSIKITLFFSFSYLPWLLHPLQAQQYSVSSLCFKLSSGFTSCPLYLSHTKSSSLHTWTYWSWYLGCYLFSSTIPNCAICSRVSVFPLFENSMTLTLVLEASCKYWSS